MFTNYGKQTLREYFLYSDQSFYYKTSSNTVIQLSVLHVWAVNCHPQGGAPNVRHNKAIYIYEYNNKIYHSFHCLL
jgi:hypothetical protein